MACLAPASASAQPDEDADSRWESSTELSFVRTGGNADSYTLGIAATITRSWQQSEIRLETGGIRTRSRTYSRVAVGTEASYQVEESSETSTSAENYYGRARLDRRFSERAAIFLKSGWTRNTFSGIRHRLVNVLGISTQLVESDRQQFRTAYGLTHTVQQDVVPAPDGDGRFLGLQISTDYRRALTPNTVWTSNLVLDANADEPADLRADWTNSLSVAMNSHVGLKTSFRAHFDNLPALARVPLVSAAGEEAGEVLVPRKTLDRVFTVALMVTF